MIKRILKETFFCDECGIKAKEQVAGEGFPYRKDWVYIYNFTFKFSNKRSNTSKDKHFCSKKCFIRYLSDNIDFEEALSYIGGFE